MLRSLEAAKTYGERYRRTGWTRAGVGPLHHGKRKAIV